MTHKPLNVSVVPSVLTWARESIGLNTKVAAKKLNISENVFKDIESGYKKLTLIQIQKLAKIYKRPLAVFFIPAAPDEPPIPMDFRSLPLDQRLPFSSKTRLAIRRARRTQLIAKDIALTFEQKNFPQIKKINLTNNADEIANETRRKLGIDIKIQFNWINEAVALNNWRKAIENTGVLVFQFGMPLKETRAFSLTGEGFPAIVLNSRDAIRARIFSLFHEYCHLLLGISGICDLGDVEKIPNEFKQTEKFCNRFAGAVLVPDEALTEHDLVKKNRASKQWSEDILIELSKDFKVSKDVILRRLLILDLTTESFYNIKYEEWSSREQRQIGWGRSYPPKKCIQENGRTFVSLVLEGHKEKKITYSDVADYLNVRLKHLPQIEQLVGFKE